MFIFITCDKFISYAIVITCNIDIYISGINCKMMAKCEIYGSCENKTSRKCARCGKLVCKLHSVIEDGEILCDRCLVTEIIENRNKFRLEDE